MTIDADGNLEATAVANVFVRRGSDCWILRTTAYQATGPWSVTRHLTFDHYPTEQEVDDMAKDTAAYARLLLQTLDDSVAEVKRRVDM